MNTKKQLKSIVKEKNKCQNMSIIFFILCLIIVIILSCLYSFYLLMFLPLALVITYFINDAWFIFNIFKSNKSLQEDKIKYKKNIVPSVLEELFENVEYIPDKGIDEKTLIDTEMINTGDSYDSEDYVKGKYKNINFEFSDVFMYEDIKDKNGNKKRETIFAGQWIIFDFKKKFKSKLLVSTNNFPVFNKLSNVQFEDTDFSNNFIVQAKNEKDAFRILKPDFIENLKKLKRNLGNYFTLYFVENKLHIALYNYIDFFEPNLYSDIDVKEEKEKIKKDLKTITDFIDVLELDNDIFKN